MDRKRLGFEINLKEGERIVKTKLSPEVQEFFKSQTGKTHKFYIEQFLGGKKIFDRINVAVKNAMKKALPKNIEKDCEFCNGNSKDEGDKKCTKYYLQMNISYVLAATEFINIVHNNRFIFDNKPVLQQLTINFFDSLMFLEGKGIMYFDLDKICRLSLEAGFISISQILSKSDTLNSLKVLNNSIAVIEDEELKNEISQQPDENYLNIQKRFFTNKQRFYKEKIFVENNEITKSNKQVKIESSNNSNFTRTHIAYCIHYLTYTKSLKTENIFPSDKAWKELGQRYNKNAKNIQKVYNEINSNTKVRLSKTKISIIQYVIIEMLQQYPKALKLAEDELKMAILKA